MTNRMVPKSVSLPKRLSLTLAVRAIDLDPLNEEVRAFYAVTLHFEHRFADEEPELRKVLATDPKSQMATGALAEALYFTGRYEESLAAEHARWAGRGDTALGGDLSLRLVQETELLHVQDAGWSSIGHRRVDSRSG